MEIEDVPKISYCVFCNKTEETIGLIDMNTNCIVLDEEIFDFSHLIEKNFNLSVKKQET